MITYNWKINNVEVIKNNGELTNIIDKVHWQYEGTDTLGFSSSLFGVIKLKDADKDNYIPISSVTLKNVIDWVKIEMGGVLDGYSGICPVTRMEKIIANEINTQIDNSL